MNIAIPVAQGVLSGVFHRSQTIDLYKVDLEARLRSFSRRSRTWISACRKPWRSACGQEGRDHDSGRRRLQGQILLRKEGHQGDSPHSRLGNVPDRQAFRRRKTSHASALGFRAQHKGGGPTGAAPFFLSGSGKNFPLFFYLNPGLKFCRRPADTHGQFGEKRKEKERRRERATTAAAGGNRARSHERPHRPVPDVCGFRKQIRTRKEANETYQGG